MTKILLVEDSRFLRLATERALAHAGYEVSSAGDGEEALRVARVKPPDVILLDMLLPKMSGLDVLKELKRDSMTRPIPVIVVTGMAQKNAERLIHDGAAGFLEKTGLDLHNGPDRLLKGLREILRTLPAREVAKP